MVDWAGVNLVTSLVYRQVTAVFLSWANNEIPLSKRSDIVKLSVSHVLQPVTTGHSHDIASQTVQRLQKKHGGLTFL